MVKCVAIVSGSDEERADLCVNLGKNDFQTTAFSSLVEFESSGTVCEAVIFDLNSLPVSNTLFQKYSKKIPGVHMVAISDRKLHPELKESMATCLTACLAKPVDLGELIYLLKAM